MRKVIKRKLYVISVPPKLSIEKIYDKIASSIRAPYAEISIRGGRAYIEIVGTEAEIKDSWNRVRNALQDLWELYRLETEKEALIESIVKEAGRTFPPESLVYALKLKGYDARLSDDKQVLYTNAPPSVVVELARRIAEIIDEIRFRVKGTAAKRMVAAIAAGLDVDPEKVIEYGISTRVLEESDEGIVLREEWRRALRKVAVMLKGAELGFE
ncbi:hypothetical protein PYJP_14680 [Pyrofollis japonicus]|uniref:DUF2067 domain-containing protein n=1 Tax=Pyrofollis japonicus TaxID=3060460 RepID=UPI00295B030B|nr:DUF2067 domain-containing protein [Pyrofollis japonicus]BEP18116.1 hypothetical protein PYJP_14680 [Pyrofollis japonicus]